MHSSSDADADAWQLYATARTRDITGQVPPIALSMGDPAGVGLDITLSAWLRRAAHSLAPFFIIADPEIIATRAQTLGLQLRFALISHPDQAAGLFASALPVLPLEIGAPVIPGHPNPAAADAIIQSIRRGAELVMAGHASALVTNPIAKAPLTAAGFPFPGHTEFLGAIATEHGETAEPVMMLVGGGLRVVPATVHIPLRDVPGTLSIRRLVCVARIVHAALRRDFAIPAPRLAMTGLNPHAGEDGTMGREEIDIIMPAIEQLSHELGLIAGPLPADTAFHARAREGFDAIIAMYHDQALVPLKTLAFDEGVNVTLGLPFVRTSPDHGTAFAIAGSGRARPDSLINALKLAGTLARTRARALTAGSSP
jgi:4-hydroxythreonine-4-phosphate dehydrogenase